MSRCHSCDAVTTDADPLTDTCADCAADCWCLGCREYRVQVAQDRAADMAHKVAREMTW